MKKGNNHPSLRISAPGVGAILKDHYTGHCPFHKDCFEGLACGPAIRARWDNKGLGDFPESPLAWEIQAYYIAQAAMNLSCMFSPQKIIIGGGVMTHRALFPKIRELVVRELNGYLSKLETSLDDYIVPPGLEIDSGIFGGVALTACMHLYVPIRPMDRRISTRKSRRVDLLNQMCLY